MCVCVLVFVHQRSFQIRLCLYTDCVYTVCVCVFWITPLFKIVELRAPVYTGEGARWKHNFRNYKHSNDRVLPTHTQPPTYKCQQSHNRPTTIIGLIWGYWLAWFCIGHLVVHWYLYPTNLAILRSLRDFEVVPVFEDFEILWKNSIK